MIKTMFVCHGNICRSTMAEFVFKDMVKKRGIADQFQIESSATSREEIGNDTHHGTKRQLDKMNISYTRRNATQIIKDDLENFDYILAMDSNNLRNLHRMFGNSYDYKIHLLLDFADTKGDIADPWYTGNFDETYNDVVRGLEGFLTHCKF